MWINPVYDEVGDSMGKGFRFAGPGSGDNQKWPRIDRGSSFNAMFDSLPLLFV